ncbi:hypothetical protein QOZ80_3BG0296890 [Eleusine coracana subsp. coracana]|nr:hypothetical protein QOZ80_3BG0296890 [Eleusine coracana subsp. coracana]
MEATSMGLSDPWTPQPLEDLLPDLSIEERARFLRPSGGRQRIRLRKPDVPPPPVPAALKRRHERCMIPRVRDALRNYNARHPGDQFDAVKPLAEDSMHFGGQLWWHLNFWARSRSSNKIKRFFAEVHYMPATCASLFPDPDQPFVPPIPIVEVCTILEEPLSRYRNSCQNGPTSDP